MSTIAENMATVSSQVTRISADMNAMTRDVGTMSSNIADNLDPMQVSMAEINNSLQSITLATANIGLDMQRMNQHITRPMSFMNSMMPW